MSTAAVPAGRTGRAVGGRIIAAVVVVLLLAMPTLQRIFDFAVFNLIFLYFIFFWITQATSWNIFSGYSGYFSFGQGAFYGAGLYVTANMVQRYGTSLLPAIPVAGVVAGLIAVVMGLLVFRLRKLSGEIFALFSLAVALALGSLANNWSFIDGGRGIPIGTVEYPSWLGSTTEMLYYLGLVLAIAAVVTAYVIQHSRLGFGLFAIRDDERVAEAIGVPTFRYKLVVLIINGALAGMAGAVHAVQVNFIAPQSAFSITVPLFVILMSVVGGRRHWAGPVIGAILIHTISDELIGLGLAEVSQILLGLLLIAATLFLRRGVATRLLQRPVPASVITVTAFVGLLLFTDETVISSAAIALVVALVALVMPNQVYDRVGWRRQAPLPPASADGDDEHRRDRPEVPIEGEVP